MARSDVASLNFIGIVNLNCLYRLQTVTIAGWTNLTTIIVFLVCLNDSFAHNWT